ncbi:MAG TPA: T9SS type A sorting domain-containing protein [Bacteroidia bacterium]|nr:T9SS type A sorting domain-containing protein [Bacteroidia bacterium]
MKKHLLIILAFLCSGFLFSQSVPNGGFENWNTITYDDPNFYQTSNMHGNNGAQGTVNAEKTNDAWHGNYAIKLTTKLVGNDTIFAYFADGDPGKNPPQGGHPYNQAPTGIRFHYKSNIMAGDSSLVLLMFKKAGVLIGQYMWAINSSQSSYTLFSKNLSPALPTTPDTVVIGIASSFPFGGNRGTPGTMIQIDSLNFTGVASQPIAFNGDLENWQSITNSQVVGWKINGNNQNLNYRTTDKYSGSYALELQTQPPSFGGGNVSAAYATTGHFTQNGPQKGGLPFSNQIDTLVFYYKYLPAHPMDSALISISFSANGINIGGLQEFLGVSGGYQMVQIPINIMSVPDTMLITLASSSYTTYPLPTYFIGSDFKIDNMYLKSQKMPVANFSLPVSGCIGQAITLNDNSANMVSGWNWIMPGGTPSSSTLQNPQITYSSAGTKTITLYATNNIGGSTNTSAAYTRTIAIFPVPNVNSNSSIICAGSSATLIATGATNYTWSSGQTTNSIVVTPSVTSFYTVTGSTNGCSNSAFSAVVVPATTIPEICMVSTDSLFQNNIIYWDKTITNKVDSFIIYREVSSGVYKRIGAQPYAALSRFIDTTRSVGPANGDPNITSYRYKLQLRDSCGNYSALSPYHNTFFFNAIPNTGNFIWNSYSVENLTLTPVSTCNLLRDNLGTNTWTVVGNCAGTQTNISDPAFASFPNALWRIDGLGFNCNPTYKTAVQINKSKSNVKNNFNVPGGSFTSINANELISSVSIAPNPSTTDLTVYFSNTQNLKTEFVITDLLGKVVFIKEVIEGNNITISVNNLTNGIYFIKIQQGKNSVTKKFIKE